MTQVIRPRRYYVDNGKRVQHYTVAQLEDHVRHYHNRYDLRSQTYFYSVPTSIKFYLRLFLIDHLLIIFSVLNMSPRFSASHEYTIYVDVIL